MDAKSRQLTSQEILELFETVSPGEAEGLDLEKMKRELKLDKQQGELIN